MAGFKAVTSIVVEGGKEIPAGSDVNKGDFTDETWQQLKEAVAVVPSERYMLIMNSGPGNLAPTVDVEAVRQQGQAEGKAEAEAEAQARIAELEAKIAELTKGK